ncbi:hypothetical protein [Fischerella sp. PCC 9605]|nr:hypothetical protein [Fischerella sp. PCC 9605]
MDKPPHKFIERRVRICPGRRFVLPSPKILNTKPETKVARFCPD